jgi:hypothetical protein
MIDAQGRRVRARIVKTERGTTHVEYRLGTDRYYSRDDLAEAMEG